MSADFDWSTSSCCLSISGTVCIPEVVFITGSTTGLLDAIMELIAESFASDASALVMSMSTETDGGIVCLCKVVLIWFSTWPCFLNPTRIFSGADFELISGGRNLLESALSSSKKVTGGLVLVGEAPVTVALRRIKFLGLGYNFQKRECAEELLGLFVEVDPEWVSEPEPEPEFRPPPTFKPGDLAPISPVSSESIVSKDCPVVNWGVDEESSASEPGIKSPVVLLNKIEANFFS